MKNVQMTTLSLIGLLLLGAGCTATADVDTRAETDTNQPSIDQQVNAGAETRADSENEITSTFATWSRAYADWQSQIRADVDVRTDTVQAELQDEWQTWERKIAQQQANVEAKIQAMQEASTDLWVDAHAEAESALEDLEDVYLEARTEMDVHLK